MRGPVASDRDRLEQAVAADRAALHLALSALGSATRRQFDVRQRIAAAPGAWLVAAALLGGWLGARASGTRTEIARDARGGWR